MGALYTTEYRVGAIIDSTRAFHAILWNRSILSEIGAKRISDLIVMVRISKLPKEEFRRFASILSLASCDESQIPLRTRGMAQSMGALSTI